MTGPDLDLCWVRLLGSLLLSDFATNVVSRNGGTPKWMVYSWKTYKKIDDWGVPPFQETSMDATIFNWSFSVEKGSVLQHQWGIRTEFHRENRGVSRKIEMSSTLILCGFSKLLGITLKSCWFDRSTSISFPEPLSKTPCQEAWINTRDDETTYLIQRWCFKMNGGMGCFFSKTSKASWLEKTWKQTNVETESNSCK